MKKIIATLTVILAMGFSSSFAGTLVINIDLNDQETKAAYEWAINKFQEEQHDVTIEDNN